MRVKRIIKNVALPLMCTPVSQVARTLAPLSRLSSTNALDKSAPNKNSGQSDPSYGFNADDALLYSSFLSIWFILWSSVPNNDKSFEEYERDMRSQLGEKNAEILQAFELKSDLE